VPGRETVPGFFFRIRIGTVSFTKLRPVPDHPAGSRPVPLADSLLLQAGRFVRAATRGKAARRLPLADSLLLQAGSPAPVPRSLPQPKTNRPGPAALQILCFCKRTGEHPL
jgi:hypothetical protein